MGIEFIPEMEANQISVTVKMPDGSSYEDLKNTSAEVIDRLLEISEIKQVGAMDSSASMLSLSAAKTKSASMYIILDENKKKSNKEIQKEIISKTENINCEIKVSTSNMDMSALGGSGLEVIIRGNDLDKLQESAKDIAKIMKDTEGIEKVEDGIGDTSKQLSIIVDKSEAMKSGLTVAQIYSNIASKLVSEKESTTITIENKEFPVIVAISEENKLSQDDIKDIAIEATNTQANGEKQEIVLDEIVDIQETNSLNSISRENGQRYISVVGTVDSEHNIGLVSRDFENKMKEYKSIEDVTIEIAGENETIMSSLKDLGLMILLAVVFIYLIMVAQFQSLKAPFIVMFTIPLAFTGGFLALFFTGTNVSIIAMLGLLILAGIVVNNGIVLIDYINQLRIAGKQKNEAILQAGKTRLRPILMTALTTILGLSTMALGIGMGADMIQPLGIVTIGGLIYSTLLTLFVVPCIYDIAFRK